MDSSGVGGTTSLKEYLKRYESTADGNNNKKKKKSDKKLKGGTNSSGVIVVDRDPVWQKPLMLEEEQENDSPDEKPVVDEDIEVKRMKRLDQIRARRAFNAIADDGSGWISLSPKHKQLRGDIDISPPRRSKFRRDTPSPEGNQANLNSDLSPPRKRESRRHGFDDFSPPRKSSRDHMKQDIDDDLSPPRKRESGRYDSDDLSPRKRNRGHMKQDIDDDLSPPRKRESGRYDSVDLSPRKRNRDHLKQDLNEDLSLPRKREAMQQDADDFSPPRMSKRDHMKQYIDISSPRKRESSRQDSTDLSPPRQGNSNNMNRGSVNDLSAHRKQESMRYNSHDYSPPRKSNRAHVKQELEEDLSPPRKREVKRQKTDDFSPSRKSNRDHIKQDLDVDVAPPKTSKLKQDPDVSPRREEKHEHFKSKPPKASSKAGLLSGTEMRDEILKTKKEDNAKFELMDPSISGKGAQAVYRDKKGNKISKEEHMKLNQKVEEKPKLKKIEWGKGLAQKREAEEKLIQLELEKEKPFARTRDDPELDAMLKERVRWGDPMAHLVKKKALEPVLHDLGNSEKMKESGFIVPQDVPAHSWIKRGIDAAPNRYGIRPGRHWDGVDRSTGFEKQIFKRANEKRASESEAYIWSVADM